jgi:hypothetical protein
MRKQLSLAAGIGVGYDVFTKVVSGYQQYVRMDVPGRQYQQLPGLLPA